MTDTVEKHFQYKNWRKTVFIAILFGWTAVGVFLLTLFVSLSAIIAPLILGVICFLGIEIHFWRVELDNQHFNQGDEFENGAQTILQLTQNLLPIKAFYDPPKLAFTKSYWGIKAERCYLVVETDSGSLVLTPKTWWFIETNPEPLTQWQMLEQALTGGKKQQPGYHRGLNVSTGRTTSLRIEGFEDDLHVLTTSPRDVLARTWRYTTKSGDKDYRYKNNPQVYVVRRYRIHLKFDDEVEVKIGDFIEEEIADKVWDTFKLICGISHPEKGSDGNVGADEDGIDEVADLFERPIRRPWYEVLGLSEGTTDVDSIESAYREKIRACHPDTVATRSERIRAAAAREARELNIARDEALKELHQR